MDYRLHKEAVSHIDSELNIIVKSNYFDLSKHNFRMISEQIGLDHESNKISFAHKGQQVFSIGADIKANICRNRSLPEMNLELTLCKPYERNTWIFYSVLLLMFVALWVSYQLTNRLESTLIKMISKFLEKAGLNVSQNSSLYQLFHELKKTNNSSKLYQNEAADLLAATAVNNKNMHVIHEMSAEIGVLEDFLKKASRSDHLKSHLSIAGQAIERLKLKRKCLLQDRIEAKQQFLLEKSTTIDLFIDDLRSMCDSLVNRSSKQIEIHYEITPSMQALPYSRIELTSILTGLVKNSIEAIRDKGTIIISIEVDGDHITFNVNDDGPGLSEKDLSIVSKYTKTSSKGDCSGGGLFFISHLVKSYLGKFKISSIPGEFTGVKISLPVNTAN